MKTSTCLWTKLSLFCIAFVLALGGSASAVTFTTTSFTDHPVPGVNNANGQIIGGPGAGLVTLRSAVAAANAQAGPHTVNLLAGTYLLSQPTVGGFTPNDLVVGSNLNLDTTIQGPDPANPQNTIIQMNVAGNDVIETALNSITFLADLPMKLTLKNLTVTGGDQGGIFTGGDNGALRSQTTIDHCLITGNTNTSASFPGGAIIVTGGDLTVTFSTISGNTTPNATFGQGGGIDYSLANPSGAFSQGTLLVQNSTFTNNTAGIGANFPAGGAIFVSVVANNSLTVDQCIFTANQATGGGDGGAIAVSNTSPTMAITRNNFSGNQALTATGKGGAIVVHAGATNINFNRFTGNTATVAANGNTIRHTTGNVSTVNANDNWWLSNTGPAVNDITGAAVTVANSLQLKLSSSPTTVIPGGTSTLTASFLSDSANNVIAAGDAVQLVGKAVTFGGGALGSPSGAQPSIQAAGTATATFTAGALAGVSSASAVVDGVTANANVNIQPTVTSAVTNIPFTATTLTITGTGFSLTPANNSVVFTPTGTGTVTGSTATTLTVTGVAGLSVGALNAVVTTNTVSSVLPVQVATVTSLSITPNTANLAQNAPTLTITGLGFSTTLANNTVTLSPTGTATVTAATATQLTCTLGGSLTPGVLNATVAVSGSGSAGPTQVATVVAAPTVTANSTPLSVNATQLIITGTNFSATPASNTVVLSSGTATVTASTTTQLTCTVVGPLSLGSLTAVVTANGGSSGVPVQVAIVAPPLALPSINVGTGGDYTSLTNTGGLFEALNGLGTTVNITVNITSDLAGELGTNALNQLAGGFTVLIRPSGGPRTISGSSASSLIRLNDADNVTIDGSTTGATATGIGGSAVLRELTITNTNVGTSAVVLALSGVVNGAQNNTFKNLNIVGQNPLTTLLGISLGGATPGTAGLDNDNNRVENCSVQKAIFGIYSAGTSPANPNTGTVITRNDVSATTTNRIRRVGILLFNDNGAQITENSVGGMDSNESADAIGIGIGTQGVDTTTVTSGGVINANVSRNKISGVNSNSASGFSAAGITVGGGSGGANTIANNMITGVIANATSPDFPAGIFVVGATGSSTKLFYNSIALTGNRGATAGQMPGYGVAITGADPTVELKNNIFYNTQDPGSGGANAKSYAIGMGATTFANLDSNYNDFFSGGTLPGFFRSGSLAAAAGTNYATLALWQAAVSDDVNSRGNDPLFVNLLTDLHLQAASTMMGAGTPVAGVTVDFDGATRNPATPDIGADEVASAPLVATNPASTLVTVGGTATFNAAASGVPVPTVQWEVSTNGGGTFSPIPAATSVPLSFVVSFSQNQNQYRAVFTNIGGSATTTAATLTVNRPPTVGNAVALTRTAGSGFKIATSQLLASANVTDPDADPLTVTGGSAVGGVVVVSGGFLIYTPNAGNVSGEAITYTVSDGRGGTVNGTINVTVPVDNAPTNNITKFTKVGGSPAVVDFVGIPGFTYGVQYKLNLGDPTWLDIGPVTMDQFGAAHFTDNGPGSAPRTAAASGFYRFIYPAP